MTTSSPSVAAVSCPRCGAEMIVRDVGEEAEFVAERRIETLDDALRIYYEAHGELAPIPSRHSEYDAERGGWVLENVNGQLALVRDDGEIE